jgi:hypothetical protein
VFCQELISGAARATYWDRLLSIHMVTNTGGQTPCEKSLRLRRIGSSRYWFKNVVQYDPELSQWGLEPMDLDHCAASFNGSPRQGKARETTSSTSLPSIWADW